MLIIFGRKWSVPPIGHVSSFAKVVYLFGIKVISRENFIVEARKRVETRNRDVAIAAIFVEVPPRFLAGARRNVAVSVAGRPMPLGRFCLSRFRDRRSHFLGC